MQTKEIIMQNLQIDLIELLKSDARFVNIDGKLLKATIVANALQLDAPLLKLLLSHPLFKKTFFTDIDGILIFDKIKFQTFVTSKQFLPDSYTSFKNKIGLMEGDDYLTTKGDVVLAWGYKDCVLEGGQTKDDAKSSEIFWNETLAPEQVDKLVAPKVLTGFKRHDKDGVHDVEELNDDDNFIVKGNNLQALHTLYQKFGGKVKLIYIDPPYNTGSDSFKYNDSFNHSTWLTFMKNRLEVARNMLREDGSIWISADDSEAHYLKVLCDEVFRRENFVANVIWEKKYAPQNDAKWLSDNHDHILLYAKNKEVWRLNLLPRTDEMNARYKNPDNDPRGDWMSDNLSVKTYSKANDFPITTPFGRVVNPPNGSCWRISKAKLQEMITDNRIWFGSDSEGVPRIKRFLSEVKDGMTPLTIWSHSDVGHNQDAKKEVLAFNNEDTFDTPKPERLIERIIHLSTKPNDLVLDYHLGSGTTAAVAHKMGRRYIGIEQMDYMDTITVPRLEKVIAGEQGGVSKAHNWQGGGSFVYCELLKDDNQIFIDKIQASNDEASLKACLKA
jgi:adenine-specific DNA-methyltransferase